MARLSSLALVLLLAAVDMPFHNGVHGGQRQDLATPTLQQWMSLKGAGNPRISPDGSLVAYTIRSANWEANSFVDEIWIANVGSGESYQLTDAKGSSWEPRWSPDSKRLAFLCTRDGGTQIYLAS